MAMVQRDKYIEDIQKTDALLEYAVMHGDEVEAERLRAKLRWLTNMGDPPSHESSTRWDCKPIWNGNN